MSSRHTESRPPESSTTIGPPTRPVARTRSRTSLIPDPRDEQLGRLLEALQAHLADEVELEVRARRLDHRARDEHLPARGAGDDARGEVDLAPVVVAVAVDGLPAVDADARERALGVELLEADGPVGQARRVGGDDHDLVADRLDDPRVLGQRALDRLDEVLDRGHRLLVALLLGQPRVAG